MQLMLFDTLMEKPEACLSGKTYLAHSATIPTLLGVSLPDSSGKITLLSLVHDLNADGPQNIGGGARKPIATFQSGQTRVLLLDPGGQSLGGSTMPNISDWPNDASVCSLSDVIERQAIPRKYFLSPTACAGILRRAEKRGKNVPERLRLALQAVADSART
jgi:hypothetical protein